MTNYPDNCNGSGDDLPWNKPDDVPVCTICGKPMSDDDEFSDVCDECLEEDDDE